MTTTTSAPTIITKKFTSGKQLSDWKNNPMTSKLYTIKYVNWTNNTVQVEALPLN